MLSSDATGQRIPFRVVIPARYESTRLPGKPLLELAGRSLVMRAWDSAVSSQASDVVVATDDERIRTAVERNGGRAFVTSPDHASGTDRIAEVVTELRWPHDTIVLNLQSDEPLLPPALLTALASTLHATPAAHIATLATPIRSKSELLDPNTVKVITDESGYALYFSRSAIPWTSALPASSDSTEALSEDMTFLRHIGLYAYRAAALRHLWELPRTAYETLEGLEQLRALAHGLPIYVRVVAEPPPHGIDTPDDYERVRQTVELDGQRR